MYIKTKLYIGQKLLYKNFVYLDINGYDKNICFNILNLLSNFNSKGKIIFSSKYRKKSNTRKFSTFVSPILFVYKGNLTGFFDLTDEQFWEKILKDWNKNLKKWETSHDFLSHLNIKNFLLLKENYKTYLSEKLIENLIS